MKIFLLTLTLLSAHFSLTPFAPADKGKAWIFWPFETGVRPFLAVIGGLPSESGSIITPFLAGIAGICFLMASCSLFGLWINSSWFSNLVIAGSISSIVLFILYFGPYSVLPIAINLLLLWGMLSKAWRLS